MVRSASPVTRMAAKTATLATSWPMTRPVSHTSAKWENHRHARLARSQRTRLQTTSAKIVLQVINSMTWRLVCLSYVREVQVAFAKCVLPPPCDSAIMNVLNAILAMSYWRTRRVHHMSASWVRESHAVHACPRNSVQLITSVDLATRAISWMTIWNVTLLGSDIFKSSFISFASRDHQRFWTSTWHSICSSEARRWPVRQDQAIGVRPVEQTTSATPAMQATTCRPVVPVKHFPAQQGQMTVVAHVSGRASEPEWIIVAHAMLVISSPRQEAVRLLFAPLEMEMLAEAAPHWRRGRWTMNAMLAILAFS